MPKSSAQQSLILVADDDEYVREHLVLVLEQAGHRTAQARDGAEAIEGLRSSPDVAIVDLDMPRASGLEVLSIAASRHSGLPVIMLSGVGEAADAVAALKRGAFDYITKPFEPDELVSRVREALRISRLESDNESLKTAQAESAEPVAMVAEAPASVALLERADRCAGVDSTVLITGPSGTGKSRIARYVHQKSPRAGGRFVSVNCAALPRELIESELFGHEKGAFTGATQSRAGRFEMAAGGTLFLDEVGELPLDLQPKLLSAIQDRVISRVGSSETISVDVRLIAATNRDLHEAVGDRSFREDLFYRLNVLTLEIPALCTRPEDILPIADSVVASLATKLGIAKPALAISARDALLQHRWPGNVRELENVLERAMVFASADELAAADIGQLGSHDSAIRDDDLVGLTLAEIERQALLATLKACGGNRAEAAQMLGVSERTVYNRLKEYGRDEGDGPIDD